MSPSPTEPRLETTLTLPGDREILITRAFRAPAHIVFEAFTRPDLVRRWWAPASLGVEMVTCEADVRLGGHYRYVLSAGGNRFAFAGRYTEVSPPGRLIYTQIFEPEAGGEPAPGGEVVVTVTFEERDGLTHLRSHTLCPSGEVRDGIIASGMEHGMRETLDQLDDVVSSLV